MSYIYINNYAQKGKLGISLKSIDSIASKAVSEIPGASVYHPSSFQRKKEDERGKKTKRLIPALFSVPAGAQTSLSKTGKAIIKLDVALSSNKNVSEICLKIQKQVADALRLHCDALPYEVLVRVMKILDD